MTAKMFLKRALPVLALLTGPAVCFAQSPAPAKTDSGDTAWMIVASVLVLLMTPGLALFYGGMVRRKNVLSSMMHSFIMMGIVTVLWMVASYSIAFGHCTNGFFGSLEYVFGNGVSMKAPYPYSPGTIPAGVFFLFQMMFAIITPALISGAVAERMKFSGYVIFTTLWALFVYAPIACWVWNPGGWLNKMGALDFAGGTVVHLASGVAALVACIILGKRKAVVHREPIMPNNITMTLLGAGLLWVGWIGFNAGSALNAGPQSVSAFLATQLAAAAGMLGWLMVEQLRFGKPTALGAASGLVAGLVGITPASGYLTMGSSVILGLIVGAVCSLAVSLKHKFNFDDSLDVVGVHGVGGALGAILTGVFAAGIANPVFGSVTDAVNTSIKQNHGRMGLILVQIVAVAAVAAYSAAGTAIIIWITKLVVGIRVTGEEESQGLDLSLHGEAGYNL